MLIAEKLQHGQGTTRASRSLAGLELQVVQGCPFLQSHAVDVQNKHA